MADLIKQGISERRVGVYLDLPCPNASCEYHKLAYVIGGMFHDVPEDSVYEFTCPHCGTKWQRVLGDFCQGMGKI